MVDAFGAGRIGARGWAWCRNVAVHDSFGGYVRIAVYLYAVVMESRGWTASNMELHRVRFLDWLREVTSDGRLLAIGSYSGSPGARGGIDENTLEALVASCEGDGLIEVHGGMGSVQESSASLTSEGLKEVQRRHERRADRAKKAAACRDALISWLYDRYLDGQDSPNISSFYSDVRGNFEGIPFEGSVVGQAIDFLNQRGLVQSKGTWQAGIIRPRLTEKGIDCAERYDSLVREYMNAQESGVGYITHFHGDVSGQVGIGENVQQTQDRSGIDIEALCPLLGKLRQVVSAEDIDANDAAHLLTYADTIQAEVTMESPNEDVVRAAGGRLREIAGKIGNSGLAAAVGAVVNYLAITVGLGS